MSDLYDLKLKAQKEISKSSNITSSNILICCGGLRQLVDEKVIVYFKVGSHWAGVYNQNFALNYDLWCNGGGNCLMIEKCPFCQKKLKLKEKKK